MNHPLFHERLTLDQPYLPSSDKRRHRIVKIDPVRPKAKLR